jgi:AraC family transcriptional regulator
MSGLNNKKQMNYQQRIKLVITHIEQNLDNDLSLPTLSQLACWSKYHFHRQFFAYCQMNVGEYIQQCRLRRAAIQLAYRAEMITAIGLEAGFEHSESFSRAFKTLFGQTPTEFRQQPDWSLWHQHTQVLTKIKEQSMAVTHLSLQVELVTVDAIPIALMEHKGAPSALGQTIQKFIAWRKQQGLPPQRNATFNLLYDDPELTPADQYRFGLGVAVTEQLTEQLTGQNIVMSEIPAGRCAKYRHIGSDLTLGSAIRTLYQTWLPESGFQLRDFPLYLQRISMYPEVAEHQTITDIYLPLA